MKVNSNVKARGPVEDAIAELKTELDGITETVPAIDALVVGLLDALEQSADDPDQIRALISQARDEREALVAIALVVGLLDALEQSADDPDQIRALISQARADREALVAIALRGTPAEPPPES